jgi:hypothetical protein
MIVMDQVVNELSFRRFREQGVTYIAQTRAEARRFMASFVQTLVATGGIGLPKSLRAMESFNVVQLSADYNVAQWRNDEEVEIDSRRLLRSYTTKSPFLNGVVKSLAEEARGCEVRFENVNAEGLLAAYMLDGLAISLPSDDAWKPPELDITVSRLTESEDGFQTHRDRILHCSSPEAAKYHVSEVDRRRNNAVTTGRDLVEQRDRILPNLIYCGDGKVEQELLTVGFNDPRFTWVKRCLFELNDLSFKCLHGEFRHHDLRGNASPESESVKRNDQLRAMRTFKCDDGRDRFFDWHLKHYGLNYRLYYIPDTARGVVLIGYIGPHLPTQLY